MEKYLQILSNDSLRKHLSSFRLVSHRLEIEMGRHNNIPREQRFCKVCNMQQTESEYPFLLVCPAYNDLRVKFLPRYYMSWPTLHKFDNLGDREPIIVIISHESKSVGNSETAIWQWMCLIG